MNDVEIEQAFYNMGQLKGHIDGLHIQLNKPEELNILIQKVFQQIIDVLQAGTKAIRQVRNNNEYL